MKHDRRFLLPTLLALAACNSSDIQGDYLSRQNICRGEAELRAAQTAITGGTDGTPHAGVYFSECMNQSGWRVSMPKAAAASGNTEAAAASGGVSPSEGTSAIYRGVHTPTPGAPGTTPVPQAAPSAPAAPMRMPYPPQQYPATTPAARYQPARPTTMPHVPYGTGGGRQF